jgi:hypothetical protein
MFAAVEFSKLAPIGTVVIVYHNAQVRLSAVRE